MKQEISKSSQKGLVIYADDDTDDLFLVSEGFFAYAPNIDLITVRDGLELFECLSVLEAQGKTPCLIVLDINMPRLDGKSTLRRLRQSERYDDVPVVLFSTSSANGDKSFAHAHNAGFITKPRVFTDMSPIIEQFFKQCTDEVHRHAKLIQ
ncbi:MAG: response regulator [Chitinophagaceae bacterium]